MQPELPTTRRRLATLLVACAFVLPSGAHADEATDAYLAARDEVGRFRDDKKRRQFRHHYERLAADLRAIAARWPDTDRADDALYVAAQLTEELYRASRVGRDLEAAVAAYEEMATRYPTSNLADDALFTAARIRLEELGDREGARRTLERVVAMGKGADFRPRAEELLARLPPPVVAVPAAPADPEATVNAILTRVAGEIAAAEGEGGVPHGAPGQGIHEDEQAPPSGLSQVEVLPDPPPAGTPTRLVKTLGLKKSKKESQVRLRLAGPVGVQRGEVPAHNGKPRRVFFDLTPAKIVGRVKPVHPGDGVIEQVRAGQYDEDTVRLVVELKGAEEPDLHIENDPFEIQLRVSKEPKQPKPAPRAVGVASANVPVRAAASAGSAPAPAVAAAPVERPGEEAPGGFLPPEVGLRIKRIVLDAGHGGHDTGAVGPSGVKEKDVNLQIARAIKKKLEKKMPGVEVIMTRDNDSFVELADRTKHANDVGADLFISIHANANPSRRVSGVETYYLNITHDRYAMRLAARENSDSSEGAAISDLEFILADLAMKSNVDDSIRLGRHVQSSVVRRLRQDYNQVNDLGLKHALFFVLLGSRMPAILVETSFLSNRMEEKRLNDPTYRDAIADGVVKGLQRFVEERQAMNLP